MGCNVADSGEEEEEANDSVNVCNDDPSSSWPLQRPQGDP